MHDHENSERLASFADVLAGELPGTWNSVHHPTEDKDDLTDLTNRVWDLDLVAEVLAEHPLRHAAVLTRQDGAQLVVLDRPEREGFLVAAIAPSGFPAEAFRGVREPDGVVVSDDPFRSAELVAGDLLTRFDAALLQVRCNAAGIRPSRPDRVVLTWQPDGGLAAAPVSEEAAEVLIANGFVREESGIHRLSGDDSTAQAHAVRAVGPQLDARGIAVALQHPSGRIGPNAAPPTPVPSPAAAWTSATRSR
ncbi:hypothetical protein IQ279_26025 [Streptomyces verrucosisporus]|uniref:hypothetical protein n=1 Tax=Streptomyces verrucosisporus TaxID=1695161 RepID=UPI0019D26292|nr:hypothetical protein [Streptomyces verrucosisporus]MBN3933020.1 hypothetical protein [Streptomyces verrucosisporus]